MTTGTLTAGHFAPESGGNLDGTTPGASCNRSSPSQFKEQYSHNQNKSRCRVHCVSHSSPSSDPFLRWPISYSSSMPKQQPKSGSKRKPSFMSWWEKCICRIPTQLVSYKQKEFQNSQTSPNSPKTIHWRYSPRKNSWNPPFQRPYALPRIIHIWATPTNTRIFNCHHMSNSRLPASHLSLLQRQKRLIQNSTKNCWNCGQVHHTGRPDSKMPTPLLLWSFLPVSRKSIEMLSEKVLLELSARSPLERQHFGQRKWTKSWFRNHQKI